MNENDSLETSELDIEHSFKPFDGGKQILVSTNPLLLACPHCAGSAEFGQVTGDVESTDFGGEFIACTKCHASTCLMFSLMEAAKPVLAEKWNSRSIGPSANHPAVILLIDLARAVQNAMDDSEEQAGPDGRIHVIDSTNFDNISAALDALEELPDDQPGCTMNAPAKAEWALRLLPAPAPLPANNHPGAWNRAQDICDHPEVDAAIRNLIDDGTNDNATHLVNSILAAALLYPAPAPKPTLLEQTKELLRQSHAAGKVITIERTPLKPLAMGHATYEINIRELRGKA